MTCPNQKAHYSGKDEPQGYIGWHAWAEKKAKTHKQQKCDECGLYKIWVLKPGSQP